MTGGVRLVSRRPFTFWTAARVGGDAAAPFHTDGGVDSLAPRASNVGWALIWLRLIAEATLF